MPVEIVFDPDKQIAVLVGSSTSEPIGPLATGPGSEALLQEFLNQLEEDPEFLGRGLVSALWYVFQSARSEVGAGPPEPPASEVAPVDAPAPPDSATVEAPVLVPPAGAGVPSPDAAPVGGTVQPVPGGPPSPTLPPDEETSPPASSSATLTEQVAADEPAAATSTPPHGDPLLEAAAPAPVSEGVPVAGGVPGPSPAPAPVHVEAIASSSTPIELPSSRLCANCGQLNQPDVARCATCGVELAP